MRRRLIVFAFIFIRCCLLPFPVKSEVKNHNPALVQQGEFDSSIVFDAECGQARDSCEIIFFSDAIEINGHKAIFYSDILDVQAEVLTWGDGAPAGECDKEQPKLPYVRQAGGFPCWSATAAWYLLIAHKQSDSQSMISAISFKNPKSWYQVHINAFAARFMDAQSANHVDADFVKNEAKCASELIDYSCSYSQYLEANLNIKEWAELNPGLAEAQRMRLRSND